MFWVFWEWVGWVEGNEERKSLFWVLGCGYGYGYIWDEGRWREGKYEGVVEGGGNGVCGDWWWEIESELVEGDIEGNDKGKVEGKEDWILVWFGVGVFVIEGGVG